MVHIQIHDFEFTSNDHLLFIFSSFDLLAHDISNPILIFFNFYHFLYFILNFSHRYFQNAQLKWRESTLNYFYLAILDLYLYDWLNLSQYYRKNRNCFPLSLQKFDMNSDQQFSQAFLIFLIVDICSHAKLYNEMKN